MSVINMLPQSGGVTRIIRQWNGTRGTTSTALFETDSGTQTITEAGTCVAHGYGSGGSNAVVQIYHNNTLLKDTGWVQYAAATELFKVQAGDTVRVYVRSYKGSSWATTQSSYLICVMK